jgi:hypothetical protein
MTLEEIGRRAVEKARLLGVKRACRPCENGGRKGPWCRELGPPTTWCSACQGRAVAEKDYKRASVLLSNAIRRYRMTRVPSGLTGSIATTGRRRSVTMTQEGS